jgi:predicted nuclease of predicted toxin-antitoxin system
MLLLLDQNVPPGLVPRLRAAGHDAVHTRDLGLARAVDMELIRHAPREQRVILTSDGDFARLVSLSGAGLPSVVHLRAPGLAVPELGDLLIRGLAEVGGALEDGAIASVGPRGYRLHRLPVAR